MAATGVRKIKVSGAVSINRSEQKTAEQDTNKVRCWLLAMGFSQSLGVADGVKQKQKPVVVPQMVDSH